MAMTTRALRRMNNSNDKTGNRAVTAAQFLFLWLFGLRRRNFGGAEIDDLYCPVEKREMIVTNFMVYFYLKSTTGVSSVSASA